MSIVGNSEKILTLQRNQILVKMKEYKFYLSDSHRKNSELAQESLKKQKPFSREEMKAQYLKQKQKKQEM
jgi:hypothetical protein